MQKSRYHHCPHWENNEIPQAIFFWEKRDRAPPVYDLLTYEIGKKSSGKKDDIYNALVSVTLNFPTNNPLPSGKEWIFKLNKTRFGWKVIDFRISVDQAPQ